MKKNRSHHNSPKKSSGKTSTPRYLPFHRKPKPGEDEDWVKKESLKTKGKLIGEMPISTDELREWEELEDRKEYKELAKKRIRKFEDFLLKNKDLIDEWPKEDSLRKKIMDNFGIPYSPLLNLYSLTADISVRLFGISNQKLFEKLLTYVKKVYAKKHGAPRGANEQRERLDNLENGLIDAIDKLSQRPVLVSRKTSSIVEAIEQYLYTCVENDIKRDQERESRVVDIETLKDTLRAEPQSRSAMLEEAMTDLILSDPTDRIIAKNYWKTDLEIRNIVETETGKKMTRQAIEKRKTQNIKPIIEPSLERKKIRREDESREGFGPSKAKGEKPLLREKYRCKQCKQSFLSLYPLKRCRDHLGEKPFKP